MERSDVELCHWIYESVFKLETIDSVRQCSVLSVFGAADSQATAAL